MFELPLPLILVSLFHLIMFASTISSAVSIYDENISDFEMLKCLFFVDFFIANSLYDQEIPDSKMLDILETIPCTDRALVWFCSPGKSQDFENF